MIANQRVLCPPWFPAGRDLIRSNLFTAAAHRLLTQPPEVPSKTKKSAVLPKFYVQKSQKIKLLENLKIIFLVGAFFKEWPVLATLILVYFDGSDWHRS